MSRREALTFDCYGTLIDWERGIGDAFRAAAAATGFALDVGLALAAYHEIEPQVQAEAFRSYRAVLTETAKRVARRLGWPLGAAQAGFLAESLPSWPPFADTNAALESLQQGGHRLGILSNVDDDLLAGTRRHFTAAFDPDLIVTAQQVGSYKPAPGHFEAARRRIAGRPWLHVAQSLFHDVAAARALGIPVVWINRKGETAAGGSGAEREFRNLAECAEWLLGR